MKTRRIAALACVPGLLLTGGCEALPDIDPGCAPDKNGRQIGNLAIRLGDQITNPAKGVEVQEGNYTHLPFTGGVVVQGANGQVESILSTDKKKEDGTLDPATVVQLAFTVQTEGRPRVLLDFDLVSGVWKATRREVVPDEPEKVVEAYNAEDGALSATPALTLELTPLCAVEELADQAGEYLDVRPKGQIPVLVHP